MPYLERFAKWIKFSPDLAFRVSDSLERRGYCVFGPQQLERLTKTTRAVGIFLEEFAASCGAVVETTPHFKSARFVRLE